MYIYMAGVWVLAFLLAVSQGQEIVFPTQDVAYKSEETVMLHCSRAEDTQDLEWFVQGFELTDEPKLIDEDDQDDPYTISTDDLVKNLTFQMSSATAGYYGCRIHVESDTYLLGAAAVIMYSEPECTTNAASNGIDIGEPVTFTCETNMIAPLRPVLQWSRDDGQSTSDGEDETVAGDPGTTYKNLLTIENVAVSDHDVSHSCILQAGLTLSGSAAVGEIARCSTSANVIHIADMQLAYAGQSLEPGIAYSFSEGEDVVCFVSAFDMEDVSFYWATLGSTILGDTLPIQVRNVDENNWVCAARHRLLFRESPQQLVTFTVVPRIGGDSPSNDIAQLSGAGSAEIPCRRPRAEDSLTWFHTPPEGTQQVIYSTEGTELTELYDVIISSPDDQIRNLILNNVDSDTAGGYECHINGEPVGDVNVMAVGEATCSNFIEIVDGEEVTFSCSVNVVGERNPNLILTVGDKISDEVHDEPSGPGQRIVTIETTVPVTWQDFHQRPYSCSVEYGGNGINAYQDSCSQELLISHLDNVVIQYRGVELLDNTVLLKAGDVLECAGNYYPEESVSFSWTTGETQIGIGRTLTLTETMVGEPVTVKCTATHASFPEEPQADDAEFFVGTHSLPSSDMAGQNGPLVVPCSRGAEDQELRWHYMAYSQDTETLIYATDGSVSDPYEVESEDGNERNLVVPLDSATAGYYRCEVGIGSSSTGEQDGLVAVIHIEALTCPDGDEIYDDGENEAFDCTVTFRGPVDPVFEWRLSDGTTSSGEVQEPGAEDEVVNTLHSNINPDLHDKDQSCSIQFDTSSRPGVTLASYEASCHWKFNVNYIRNIEIQYSGQTLEEGRGDYSFGTGLPLHCSVDAFPQENTTFSWGRRVGSAIEGNTLAIDDSMVNEEINEYICAVAHDELLPSVLVQIVRFSAFSRDSNPSPTKDIAVAEGTTTTEIPCRAESDSETLTWRFTPQGAGEPEDVYSFGPDGETINLGYQIQQKSVPDDGYRNLILEEMDASKSGVYECLVGDEREGAAVEVFFVSDIECPTPEDVDIDDDVTFTCSGRFTSSQEPQFAWYDGGIQVRKEQEGDGDDPPMFMNSYSLTGEIDNHAVPFECRVSFEASESGSGNAAADEIALCQSQVNVRHVGNFSISYAGTIIESSAADSPSRLGVGGELECALDSAYPESRLTFVWYEGATPGIPGALGQILTISSSMADEDLNIFTCLVSAPNGEQRASDSIYFTAENRAQGSRPLQDIALSTDDLDSSVDLPCSRPNNAVTLSWYFTPAGGGGRVPVYSTTSGEPSPGYDVFITDPDDNVRNLIIYTNSSAIAGRYECEVGTEVSFVAVMLLDKVICSNLPDRRPNTENVEFGCSVNIIGGVNPRFTVSRENEIVEQITPAIPSGTSERAPESFFSEVAQEELHENVYKCEIDFEISTGLLPAEYSDSCSTPQNVYNLGEIVLKYADQVLESSTPYTLSVGQVIECDITSVYYNDSQVVFRWLTTVGPGVGGRSLTITESMVGFQQYVCAAVHTFVPSLTARQTLTFTAVNRVLGEAPKDDIAVQLDSGRAELPCQMSDEDKLSWRFTPYDDDSSEVIYASDNPSFDLEGYSIIISNPDDGIRNLIIDSVSSERAGVYECLKGEQIAGDVSVIAISAEVCMSFEDVLLGGDVEFSCSATIFGEAEPIFTIRDDGEEVDSSFTGSLEPGEPVIAAVDPKPATLADHQSIYTCNVDIPDLDYQSPGCSSQLNIIHLSEVQIQFAGAEVRDGTLVPRGADLVCSVSFYPEDEVTFEWIDDDDIIVGNEQVFTVTEDMVGQNLLLCSATHSNPLVADGPPDSAVFGVVNFILPLQDVVGNVNSIISIPCIRSQESQGLRWLYRKFSETDDDAVVIYTTSDDGQSVGEPKDHDYEIVNINDPENERTLQFTLSEDTVGYYRCEIFVETTATTGDVGTVAVMLIDELTCPTPEDIDDGSTDEEFRCSVSIIADINMDPTFLWRLDGLNAGSGVTQSNPTEEERRDYSNDLIIDTVTPALHAVNHQCIVSFDSGSRPGIRPAAFSQNCTWTVNVNHLANIRAVYAGIPLGDSSNTYRLGTGGEVVCEVDAYPEEGIQFVWGRPIDIPRRGDTLFIDDTMTEVEENEFVCSAVRIGEDRGTSSLTKRVIFTAFKRTQGDEPTQDVVGMQMPLSIEGPEIPCRKPSQEDILQWVYTPFDGEERVVYDSETEELALGYRVPISFPDDGVRTLALISIDASRTGMYTCMINGNDVGTVEVSFITDLQCPQPPNTDIGNLVTFSCSASYIGTADVDFSWSRDGGSPQDGSDSFIPGQPDPPSERLFQNTLTIPDLEIADHQIPYTCNINLPPSVSGAIAPGLVATCNTFVNVRHLTNVVVTYAGTILNDNTDYTLATNGRLVCEATGFPEENIFFTWTETGDNFGEGIVPTSVLIIDDRMTEVEKNSFRCVVINTRTRTFQAGPVINFKAVKRVAGVVPFQDVVGIENGEPVQIPCRAGREDQRLEWRFRSSAGGSQRIIFSTERASAPAVGYEVQVTDPDDGYRNLEIFQMTPERAGFYTCRINDEDVGTVEFIHITGVACPSVADVFVGDDANFLCQARLTGTVNPVFSWSQPIGANQGSSVTTIGEGDPPESRLVEGQLTVLGVQARDHNVVRECQMRFSDSSIGSQPAQRLDICSQSVNVKYITNLRITYAGQALNNIQTYSLGTGGVLECSADSFPDNAAEIVWTRRSGGPRRSNTLLIEDWMTSRQEWACVVYHRDRTSLGQSQIVTFDVVVRSQAPLPERDLAALSGDSGEIPCRQQSEDDVLEWFFKPIEDGSDWMRIYTTESLTGAEEDGYKVIITDPDDGVRNLVIEHVDERTVGTYECRINGVRTAVEVLALEPVICSEVEDRRQGAHSEFECSVNVIGGTGFNPQITVLRDGSNVNTPTEPGNHGPGVRDVGVETSEVADWQNHLQSYICLVQFVSSSSSGVQPAEYSDSCSSEIRVIHLENLEIQFANEPILADALIPFGAPLVCSASYYHPEFEPIFTWSGSSEGDGQTLEVTETGDNNYTCTISIEDEELPSMKSEEVSFFVANFVPPTQDIVELSGREVEIECDPGDAGSLVWFYRPFDGSDEREIYSSSNPEDEPVEPYSIEVGEGEARILMFTLNDNTAGFYRCQIAEASGITTADVGEIAVMMVDSIQCPTPDDINDGAIDQQFTCSVSITGPVTPTFTWELGGSVQQGALQDEGNPAESRTVASILSVPTVTADLHAINNSCSFEFSRAAFPHSRRTNYTDVCHWSVNVNYIRGAQVQYAGTTVVEGPVYELGEGGQLECVVDAYPQDSLVVGWLERSSISQPIAPMLANVPGARFTIRESMITGQQMTVQCIPFHQILRAPVQADSITFIAFSRESGDRPNRDVATVEGSPIPELPCARTDDETLLWKFLPAGVTPEEEDIYSSDNGLVEEGYEVRITNPDDGVRNLRIVDTSTNRRAGKYTCYKGDEHAGTVEVFFVLDVECPPVPDANIGRDIIFTCAGKVTGSQEPDFVWARNGIDVDGEEDENDDEEPPLERRRESRLTVQNVQVDDHLVPYSCSVEFESSGVGVVPAEQVEVCQNSVNVFHVGDITLTYAGQTLDESIRYIFSTGEEILCTVEGYPENAVEYGWIDVEEISIRDPDVTPSRILSITDEMASGIGISSYACVAVNSLARDSLPRKQVTFVTIIRAQGAAPIRDVAMRNGEGSVDIPCRLENPEDVLSWHFTPATGEDPQPQLVYTTTADQPASENYEVFISRPDDRIRNLIITTVSTSTAGIYECRINEIPVGAVAVMALGPAICDEVEPVSTPTFEFVCSVDVTGLVNPTFEILRNNQEVNVISPPEPSNTNEPVRAVHSETANVDVHHQSIYTCGVTFTQSVGEEPAHYEDTCSSRVNIMYLRGAEISYAGEVLQEGTNYTLGTGGQMECRAEGWPEDLIFYRWRSATISTLGESLTISERMVDVGFNSFDCTPFHRFIQAPVLPVNVDFTAVSRAQGNAPNQDVAVNAEIQQAELPCRKGTEDDIVTWHFTLLGTEESELIYSSEDNEPANGYSVFITNPDDGVRNLIVEVTSSRVGRYTCSVGSSSISASVMFLGPATCTEVVDTVDGQILDFACSASIIGPLNPQLTVLRDDQIVGRTIPLLDEATERDVQLNTNEVASWPIHHQKIYTCNIDFTTSTEEGIQPASYTDHCTSNLNIIHLGNVGITFGDIQISDGALLPVGGELICSSSSYPEDAVTLRWRNDDDNTLLPEGASLLISADLAGGERTFSCVAEHSAPDILPASASITFSVASFSLPTQDIAGKTGETITIDCERSDEEEGQLLEWLYMPFSDTESEVIIYSTTNGDAGGAYDVSEEDPLERPLTFTISASTAGYYSCRVGSSALTRIAVMQVDLICPNPDDVNDGEIDVMFTCSASVIAPSGVDPDFAWKISGDDKLGEMQNSENNPERIVENNVVEETISAEAYHDIENSCHIRYSQSSSTGIEPSDFRDQCSWRVRVNHVATIEMDYEGVPIEEEDDDYVLGTGGTLSCTATGYPEEEFTYRWVRSVGLQIFGNSLTITDELASGQENEFACAAILSSENGIFMAKRIVFRAESRAQGEQPSRDIAAVEGSDRIIEFPCRIFGSNSLTWMFIPHAENDPKTIYSSDDEGSLEQGYSVFVTNPDDGVRNLMVTEVTADKAGFYYCERNDPNGFVEVFLSYISDMECTVDPGESEIGEGVTYSCAADFISSTNPEFLWRRSNGFQGQGNTTVDDDPLNERRIKNNLEVADIQIVDHASPYLCTARLPRSSQSVVGTLYVDLCATQINVFHIANAEVTYNSQAMQAEEEYVLGLDGELTCQVSAYPLDSVVYYWFNMGVDDPIMAPIPGINLDISEVARNDQINQYRCSAYLNRTEELNPDNVVHSETVLFSLLSRVAGESPEADIAVGLGDRVELPCRLSDFSSILRWYYTPTGLEEDEVLLYTTENPDDIATGYSIGELTFPDDGQRNLIIETLSGNNAGSYICEIERQASEASQAIQRDSLFVLSNIMISNKEESEQIYNEDNDLITRNRVDVMSIVGPTCGTSAQQAPLGGIVTYICEVEVTGAAVPNFEWRNQASETLPGLLANPGDPPQTRRYTYFTESLVTEDIHQGIFVCEVSFQSSGDQDPAQLEEPTCTASVSVLPSIFNIRFANADPNAGILTLSVDQSLVCVVDTFEVEPSYRWERREGDGPPTISGDTLLITPQMVDGDGGVNEYTCIAQGSNGDEVEPIELDVNFRAAILPDEISIWYDGERVDGEDVIDILVDENLECVVTPDAIPEVNICWTKDQGPDDAPDQCNTNHEYNRNFLTVSSLMISEEVEEVVYTCRANNFGTENDDITATVTFRPQTVPDPDIDTLAGHGIFPSVLLLLAAVVVAQMLRLEL